MLKLPNHSKNSLTSFIAGSMKEGVVSARRTEVGEWKPAMISRSLIC
jgi:hypothetical protein